MHYGSQFYHNLEKYDLKHGKVEKTLFHLIVGASSKLNSLFGWIK